ncbi:site-specific integrase [Draconibacterium orientale]|uniref:site-specific integrase n=1 Tax=Draconibacterium orientale TaxID=1168034 RepID=UPI002ABD87E8|nr:site-specific integrase [Draconibacterium orientale]
MKKMNTFGIQFVIRKHRIKDDKAPIYARVTVNQERAEISIKKRIHVDNWNNGRGMAKGKSSEISRLNSYLEQIRSQLTECYQELVINKEAVTPEAIKNKFLGVEDVGETLKGLVEYHNTGMDSNLRWGTLKNYKTTEKYIEKFLKQIFKRNDIYLVELNYKFITDFEHFLRKYQPEDHHLPMGNNTVMKHIERLRKMTNLAVRLGWLDKDPFVAYRLSFKRVEREFLTQLELDTIKKKQFKIERLQYVKDLFVFSCYTGLSYIDVMNLQPNNIRIGINGMNWIITQREKTTTPVRIPILSQAQFLIDKYKDHPRSANKGTIFPNISNQKLNSYLKEIADVCEIDKNLTFHVARHTFATTVTLTNGVPIESVSKMLGHTDLKTTQIYAKVVEKKISDDMANLEAYLSGERSKKENTK